MKPETKKLYIHIGHYKTGSTSLQKYLADQKTSGVLYPTSGRPHSDITDEKLDSHSGLAFELLEQHGGGLPNWYLKAREKETTTSKNLLNNLTEELQENKNHETLIISSEELIRLGETPERTQGIFDLKNYFKHYETKIVCYLKDPVSHLESWYSQLVGLGTHPEHLNNNYETYKNSIHFQYAKTLKPWAETFGKHNMIVKPLIKDVTNDFCDITNLEKPSQTYKENKSTPKQLIEAERTWRATREDKNEILHTAITKTLKIAPNSNEKIYILDAKARTNLINEFLQINEELGIYIQEEKLFENLDQLLNLNDHISDLESFKELNPWFQTTLSALET